jgi:hypothetical protein
MATPLGVASSFTGGPLTGALIGGIIGGVNATMNDVNADQMAGVAEILADIPDAFTNSASFFAALQGTEYEALGG